MELALICAQQVIVLFLLIGVGTLAVKTGVLKLEHKQPLSNLLVNIVVPAMIVNSYQMEFSLEILRNLLAAILILLAVLTLLAVWGFVSTHLPEQGASSVTTPESVPEEPSITEPANLVPDFVGLDYDAQVRNNRSYVGDYLFYVTLEYSDTVAEGKIIRQEPAAGELLEEGGTISLVVSKGPEMIEMPNVIGFTQEGAVKELESRGLVPSCFMVVNDGSYASGCVVSCSAEAGTSVEAGSVIVVYIAADPSVENVPATPEQPAASDNTVPADGSGEAPADSMEYDTD